MKKIIWLLVAIIFLSSKIPTWAATSCRGRSDCPSGYECVYLDEFGDLRLDSSKSNGNAFCARIYQGVTSVPTKIQPTPTLKYAKEGEFCGAGPKGVVQCGPELKCDYSRNTIQDNSEVEGYMVGAGGICVKDISTVKPTIIDNCRLKVCGDANCDGLVNSLDLIIWKRESENSTNSRSADFNNDGKVDKADYDMLQLGLQKKCGVPTPSTKYAKEGEFCGAGPNGVVECEPGLKCDYSRNRINEDNSDYVSVEIIGAGGVCVRVTPIAKPTIIDSCRLKICGDANCDGKIDIKDRLAWFRERIRPGAKTADFNKDGKVDTKDYSILLSGIRGKCEPVTPPKVTVVPTRKPVVTPLPTTYCRGGYYGGTYGPSCNTTTSSVYSYYLLFSCADNTPGVVGDINQKTCYNKNDLVNMAEKFCSTHSVCSTPTPTASRITMIPTKRLTPTRAPTRAPVTKKFCETNSDCLRTETCYQPPMPTCPPGENCIQVMPQKYCKPMVVSEVTGVEEKSMCRESKGDANRDGKINLTDYALWRYEYAKGTASKADFNCDQKVDLTDYKIWKESFMQTRSLMVSESN